MRVLVCGGRHYANGALVWETLDKYHKDTNKITHILQGGAGGADAWARVWAIKNGIPVTTFPAAWKDYGTAAGPIRNKQMIDEGKPDIIIAFPGGSGTANMVGQAMTAKIEVVEILDETKEKER